MNWAKGEFEANDGSLTPVCFVVDPGGIEAIVVDWGSRSEKHKMYHSLAKQPANSVRRLCFW